MQGEITGLLRATMLRGEERYSDARLWRWKHVINPAGPSIVYVAVSPAGDVVSVRPLMRWRLQADGEPVPAYRAVDSATRSDYQRQGLFSRETALAAEAARAEGAVVIIGTPGPESLGGYKRLGWNVLARPSMRSAPVPGGRLPRAMFRVAKSALSAAIRAQTPRSGDEHPRHAVTPAGLDDFKSAVDALDGSPECQSALSTIQTGEYLIWRYLDHPRHRYGLLIERKGGVTQWAVLYRVRRTRLGLRMVLVEQFAAEDGPSAVLGWATVDQLREAERADLVAVFCNDPASIAGAEVSGFTARSKASYVFTCRPLATQFQKHASDFRLWRIHFSDVGGF